MVMEEIRRLDDMVRSFLKYGKPLNLTRQPADVRTLLGRGAGRGRPEGRRGARSQVKRDYPTELPEIWVDVPHLKTCFMNSGPQRLSGHAGRRGVPGDGGRRQSRPPARHPRREAADGWLEIRFQDTGIGNHSPRTCPRSSSRISPPRRWGSGWAWP